MGKVSNYCINCWWFCFYKFSLQKRWTWRKYVFHFLVLCYTRDIIWIFNKISKGNSAEEKVHFFIKCISFQLSKSLHSLLENSYHSLINPTHVQRFHTGNRPIIPTVLWYCLICIVRTILVTWYTVLQFWVPKAQTLLLVPRYTPS